MYKRIEDWSFSKIREGLSRYNHVSNGGYSFNTVIRDNSQFLEITLSNYGMGQTTIIDLNKNTIQSLLDVLQHAKHERQAAGLDERDSYTVNTPEPDPSYREFYAQLDSGPAQKEWTEKKASCTGCDDSGPEEPDEPKQYQKPEKASKSNCFEPEWLNNGADYPEGFGDYKSNPEAEGTEAEGRGYKEEILEAVDAIEEFFFHLLNKTKK